MFSDLHAHTYCSDGIFSPVEVIKKAETAGLEYFAIADHDTVDAYPEIKRAETKLKLIPAIEFTCTDSRFAREGNADATIHMLGYGIDTDNVRLKRALALRDARREDCINGFLDSLETMGFELHERRILVNHGSCILPCDLSRFAEKLSGFEIKKVEVLTLIKTCVSELKGVNFDVETAMELIHAAGGISVWAHPFISYSADEKRIISSFEEVEYFTKSLASMGLSGIESEYALFNDEKKIFLRQLAGKFSLVTAGGSDYHGYEGRDSFVHIESCKLTVLDAL